MTGERYYFFGSGRTNVFRYAILEIWEDTGEVHNSTNRFYLQRELLVVYMPLDNTAYPVPFFRTDTPSITAGTVNVNPSHYGDYSDPDALLAVLSGVSLAERGVTQRRITDQEYARLRMGMLGLINRAAQNQAYLPGAHPVPFDQAATE